MRFVVFAVLLSAVAGAARADESAPQRRVLIVNSYKLSPGFALPVNEAEQKTLPEKLKAVVAGKGQAGATVTVLCSSRSDGTARPTGAAIRAGLADTFASVRPHVDSVVIYLGGMGYENADGPVFFADDVDFAAPGSMIRLADVIAAARASCAVEVLILYEACRQRQRNGADLTVAPWAIPPAGNSVGAPGSAFKRQALTVVRACPAEDRAYFCPTSSFGHLTCGVLAGLAGAADADGNGRVTANELVEYLEKDVSKTSLKVNKKMQQIDPTTEGSGAWTVARCEPRKEEVRKDPPAGEDRGGNWAGPRPQPPKTDPVIPVTNPSPGSAASGNRQPAIPPQQPIQNPPAKVVHNPPPYNPPPPRQPIGQPGAPVLSAGYKIAAPYMGAQGRQLAGAAVKAFGGR